MVFSCLLLGGLRLHGDDRPAPQDTLSDFRIRGDFQVPLNTDAGWAAVLNQPATAPVDQPFRLRLQVLTGEGRDSLRHYTLRVRRNGGPWEPVHAADFPYPAYASPMVSIVDAPYPLQTATSDLLPHPGEFEHNEDDGTGLGGFPVSTRAGETGVATEWEWPLVIRLYADGPQRAEPGDIFEFGLAHLFGDPVPRAVSPRVALRVPDGHLGGTFVESPGRIGPWQTSNGDLYFIMEPTETDNRFIVVKSSDGGSTWREVDGAHRPPARDLEAVDARLHKGVLHILHQEDSVWYHTFHTSDSPGTPDRWEVRSEPVADPDAPPVQSVALAVLSDNTRVAFHADGPAITIRQRDPDGSWRRIHRLSAQDRLSGVHAVVDPNDRIYFVYTSASGKAWLHVMGPGGEPGPAVLLSNRLATSEADASSILPPAFLPASQTAVIAFRQQDGRLFERRLHIPSNSLSPGVRITDRPVIQNAVDSDQTGADLVAVDARLCLFFIDQSSRDIFYTVSSEQGRWSPPRLAVGGIQGSWVRAQPLRDGRIGFVYDAGSRGGSGRNRFGAIRLPKIPPFPPPTPTESR